MFGWSIKLFRVRGIQLAVHWSFVLLLVPWAWDGYHLAGIAGALWDTLLLMTFFTCIVLHELGHAFTGMAFGVRVRRILLMPIGGMAEFDRIPRSPRQELLITIAGPAVNFAIAGLLWLPWHGRGSPPQEVPRNLADLLALLMVWNLRIGVFNLIPAFPMDGGRIVRALFATTMAYPRATFWAATIGKATCVAGIIWGLALPADPGSRVLIVSLFLFIAAAGEAEYRSIRAQELRQLERAEALRSLATAGHDVPTGGN